LKPNAARKEVEGLTGKVKVDISDSFFGPDQTPAPAAPVVK
jgi:hypothetical protein